MKHIIIGIDFGTSTSMIKVQNDDAAGGLKCDSVIFTQRGSTTTPTLIRKLDNGFFQYGYEAEQNAVKDSQLFDNFKLKLRVDSVEEQKQGAALADKFFKYLYDTYCQQRSSWLPKGGDAVREETRVSYPAQWDEAQQQIVLDAAKNAGFPNVYGIDEPTAAVSCIINVKKSYLKAAGFLQSKTPLHILVIDMGAGTTDLAFVKVTIENDEIRTEIQTWPPKVSKYIFGGSQIDNGLEEMLTDWITHCGMDGGFVTGFHSAIKAWKENTVSVLLQNKKTVTDCAPLSSALQSVAMLVNGLNIQPFPALDRGAFEKRFHPELASFVNIINSAPQKLREGTELVILTGGNSSWYWIDDVVLGRNRTFGDVGLPQLREHPERLIRMELPSETVSRGLVYGLLLPPSPPPPPPPPQPTSQLAKIEIKGEKGWMGLLQKRYILTEDGSYICKEVSSTSASFTSVIPSPQTSTAKKLIKRGSKGLTLMMEKGITVIVDGMEFSVNMGELAVIDVKAGTEHKIEFRGFVLEGDWNYPGRRFLKPNYSSAKIYSYTLKGDETLRIDCESKMVYMADTMENWAYWR